MSPRRKHATRRTPKQARSRDKVGRILAAARRILIEQGAGAFNTNHVAAEAGVGVGSVYEYFPNKQAIVTRLIEDTSEDEAAQILARFAELEDVDPRALVAAISRVTLEVYRENYALYRVLWAISDLPREVGHRPGEQLVMTEVRKRLEPLADELGFTDLDLTCFTAFHMVESLAQQMAAQALDRWDLETCATEITTAVLRYLRLG